VPNIAQCAGCGDPTSLLSSGISVTVPLVAFAAWLILAPVAVYFAVTEK
jgi:hypothetical protein